MRGTYGLCIGFIFNRNFNHLQLTVGSKCFRPRYLTISDDLIIVLIEQFLIFRISANIDWSNS